MTVRPVRRELVVGVPCEVAFAAFTDEIGRWWPLASHGVGGAGSTVAFAGGRLVETLPDGSTAQWGEVLDWEPGSRLRMTWHPGRPDGPATEVEVRFEAVASGRRVVLEHRGWEALAEPGAARDEYESGWPTVLAAYEQHTGATDQVEHEWVALLHTPAPDVDALTVGAQPAIGEHVAFLRRLHERGWLVAAGPFADVPGSGMTVVRVPAEVGSAEVERLARADDQSVAGGLLQVTVRPWQVVFTG